MCVQLCYQQLQSNLSQEAAQGINKMRFLNTGGLLTQVNYRTKCVFKGLKREVT